MTSSRYYFPEGKCIYVAMPKCANTTIWHTLRECFGPFEKLSRSRVNDLHDEGMFVFTSCRNPYDRAVSMWADKIVRRTGATERCLSQHPNMWIGMGFGQFMQALIAHKGMRNQHFETMSNTIRNIRHHDVIRFESLQDDWSRVEARLGIHYGRLKVENKSVKTDWREYYDGRSLQLATQYFRDDFKVFNYETRNDCNALLQESRDVRASDRKL